MKNAEFGRIGDPDGVKSYRWKYAIRRYDLYHQLKRRSDHIL